MLEQWLQQQRVSAAAFGRDIGVSRSHVKRLLSGERVPSPTLAIRIEQATHGQVPRHALRPDLWSAPAPMPDPVPG